MVRSPPASAGDTSGWAPIPGGASGQELACQRRRHERLGSNPRWGEWSGARLPAQETRAAGLQSLGRDDPLEEGMAVHSSTVAWRIPWTEEPGRLQSRGRKELDTTEAA